MTGGPTISKGVCRAYFAYDLGLGVDLDHAEGCLSARAGTGAATREALKRTGRAPTYFDYRPRPLAVTRGASPIRVGERESGATVEMLLYDFGVVSVRYEFALSGPLEGLVGLGAALHEHAGLLEDSRGRAAELLEWVRPAVARPGLAPMVEDYFIYHVEAMSEGWPAGEVPPHARGVIARLLRGEAGELSAQEIDEATGVRLSYSPHDAAIIDWNASMLLGSDLEDAAAVLEFANVELLELRFLDDRLDRALDQAYEAGQRARGPLDLLGARSAADLRRIAAFQVDSALLFEGVNNALKLVGDQHLARLYRAAGQRLHLPDWDASILRKLATLQSLYDKAADRQNNRRMEVLEWIIIGLITFEVVMGLVRLG